MKYYEGTREEADGRWLVACRLRLEDDGNFFFFSSRENNRGVRVDASAEGRWQQNGDTIILDTVQTKGWPDVDLKVGQQTKAVEENGKLTVGWVHLQRYS